MKKLVFILVLGIFVLGACGSSSDDELIVWAMGEEGNQLTNLTDKYTEETGVKVEVVAIPWDQAHDKLSTAVASKTGPDVIQLGTSWVAEFAQAGALADLSDYSSNDQFSKDLYFDGAAQTMEYDEKLYTIPWYVDTRVLYYRSDIISETCGLEGAPKTWEEMQDCSTKLAQRGDGNFAVDYDIVDQFLFVQFAWQNGWEVLNDEGKINVEDPKFIEAMEYAQSFSKSGATNYDTSIDITQTFTDGTFPMFISGPWMVKLINEADPDVEGKFSIATLPKGPVSSAANMGGSNLAIFEYSEKKEEAAKLINWLVTPKQQKEWYEIVGSLPSQKAVWGDEEFLKSGFEMEVWKKALEEAKPVPMIDKWETVAQEIVKAQERIMVSLEDPKEVAKELQVSIDEIMS